MEFSETAENMHAGASEYEERAEMMVEMAREEARNVCHVEADCAHYRSLYSGGGRGQTGEIAPLRSMD